MDITICIASFGHPKWKELVRRRALPSVKQFDVPVVVYHGTSLHEARNTCLERTQTEWVCFLDADDELEPGFIKAMETGSADVRAPSVRYVRPGAMNGQARVPKVWNHSHNCVAECLPKGNWLVVGSLVRTELVRTVGGWKDWPVYEDWDLWLRCHLAGASFEAIPSAVYRAWAMPKSRNQSLNVQERDKVHYKIIASVGL
jgi:glycosyltransferase involved in cell wall biosynthesis